jgi:hypothetical protein
VVVEKYEAEKQKDVKKHFLGRLKGSLLKEKIICR